MGIVRRLVRTTAPEVGTAMRQLNQATEQLSALTDQLAAQARANEDLRAHLAAIEEALGARDTRLDRLRDLVGRVEHYQPLYGVAGVIDSPARESADRAHRIAAAMGTVPGKRVLDIGSSLGYMSFYLADRGADVTGWDLNPGNVEVARAVAGLNGLRVEFTTRELSHETVTTIPHGEFDAVLVLAVLHHVIHFSGLSYAQQLVRELLARVPVLYLELAVKGEDPELFWDAAQPEDPMEVLALVADEAEIELLATVGTHLSDVHRPLVRVARARSVEVAGRTYAYDRVSQRAYADAPDDLAPKRRRYYYGDGWLVKEYGFSPDQPWNWQQIIAELFAHTTVAAHPGVHHAAHLRDAELSKDGARLVLDTVDGALLDEAAPLTPQALVAVVRDVVTTLRDLAALGLHHNDVRSWNILVAPDGAGWLIDYGLVSPTPVDDDLVGLTWAVSAGLTGRREGYQTGRSDLPGADLFADGPLAAWYAAVAAGERDHDTLLALLATTDR